MRFSVLIMASHGKPCPYCKTMMKVDPGKRASRKSYFPTRDHVVPKSVKPGSPVLIVCQKCNSDKKNLTLPEWYKQLSQQSDPRASNIRPHAYCPHPSSERR